jgi:hypothetical protein
MTSKRANFWSNGLILGAFKQSCRVIISSVIKIDFLLQSTTKEEIKFQLFRKEFTYHNKVRLYLITFYLKMLLEIFNINKLQANFLEMLFSLIMEIFPTSYVLVFFEKLAFDDT